MNVNQKIEDALADLVNNNIWPLSCPKETPPEEWITYNPELETPRLFGDDTDLEWMHYMQLHWFKKGQQNYLQIRKKIRQRLREAGFTVTESVSMYEKDTKTTHLIISCNIEEDD